MSAHSGTDLTIRSEEPEDFAAIATILEAAFDGPDEARLVERLREVDGAFAYVAVEPGGEVVGHLMFSPVRPEIPTPGFRALGLAPLSVRPDRQRRGVGEALMHYGLSACERAGVGLVVLLGHTDYYPRFGFVPGSEHGLRCKWTDGPAFQVRELVPGAADSVSGLLEYDAVFDG